MEITQDKIDNMLAATEVMKLLSHPVRLAILCTLIDRGEMSAGDIAATLADMASTSQVSQYLGLLREHDLVQTRREAQTIYYSMDSPLIRELISVLYRYYCG